MAHTGVRPELGEGYTGYICPTYREGRAGAAPRFGEYGSMLV